jgi:hypothetical protein
MPVIHTTPPRVPVRNRWAWALWRTLALAVVAAGLAGGSVLGLAAPAQAHNYPVSTVPAAGSTLTSLPGAFVITTNAGLLTADGLGSFAFQIIDSAGRYYGDGCITVSGPSMSTAPVLGPAGRYTIVWQVVSADSHIVSFQYTFTWAPTVATVAAKGSATPGTCHGTTGLGAKAALRSYTPTASDRRENLGDVLWIGGAVVGVGLAVAITLFAVGRRPGREPPDGERRMRRR